MNSTQVDIIHRNVWHAVSSRSGEGEEIHRLIMIFMATNWSLRVVSGQSGSSVPCDWVPSTHTHPTQSLQSSPTLCLGSELMTVNYHLN